MANVSFHGSVTANQKRRAAQTFATIPAFPNWFPYNDLLIDGKLIAKSRSWTWKHRGLTLLYTSSRVAHPAAEAHGMDPKYFPRKAIIGIGELVDVRPLTDKEWNKLRQQFNNATPRGMQEILATPDRQYIEPFEFGYFFRNLRRFKEPVPFSWPPGPVLPIGVPVSLVAKELRKLGIQL